MITKIDKVVQTHLERELGDVIYKELAAAREKDHAARIGDYILFSIMLVAIMVGCTLISLRLELNPIAVREAYLKQNGKE